MCSVMILSFTGMTDMAMYSGCCKERLKNIEIIWAVTVRRPLKRQRERKKSNLYRSSDLGEPHLSGSLCCDEAQILS